MGMNQDTTLDGGGDFVVGYATRDFDFILACMALEEAWVEIRVQQCMPEPRRKGRMDQVRFYLAVYEGGKPLANSTSFFDQLRLRYQNNAMRVNPRRLSEQQRTLRSMMMDVLERARMAEGRSAAEGAHA